MKKRERLLIRDYKNPLYFLVWGMLLMILSLKSSGQNVFIQLRDGENFRAIADAVVEFRAGASTFIIDSEPDGSVSANLPTGNYNITFTHPAYQQHRISNVRIAEGELTTMEVLLTRDLPPAPVSPEPGTTAPSRPETQPSATQPPRTTSEDGPWRKGGVNAFGLQNPVFLETGFKTGGITAAKLGVGVYFLPQLYAAINYNFSQQKYSSPLFDLADSSYVARFNRINLNIGYEFPLPINMQHRLLLYPNIDFGAEFARNDNLITNSQITGMRSTGLSAGIDLGLNISVALLYLGVDYSLWLSKTANQQGLRLQDGDNGNYIGWGDDLFPGRKGLSLKLGVKLFIY